MLKNFVLLLKFKISLECVGTWSWDVNVNTFEDLDQIPF